MENAMNTVLGTTVLILLILLIRRLFWKKCNPNILYFLWFFVAMRILLPVHIPLVLQNSLLSESILNNTSVDSYESSEDGKEVTERNELSDDKAWEQPNEILDDVVLGGANVVSNNSSLPEFEDNTDNPGADTSNSDSEEITAPKAKPVIKPGTVFAVVWCLGSILMALYFILVNIYAFRNIEKTRVGRLRNKIDIYEAAGYNCLVGVFKPRIFLDSRILNNPQYKKFVLLHEMEHYKAKDNFWLIIRNLCLIVQWFNPFVWIAYFKVQEDCELACDYRVLSGLSKSEKESYAETLLYILESKQKRTAFASSAGNRKAVIKKRLQCVFEQRKTKWFRMLFLLMGVVTVTTFLKVTIKGKELDDTQIEKYEPEQEMVIQDDDGDNTEDNTEKAKNNWYQRTKLVTKDMEIRELSEEELEKLVQLQQELFAGLSEEEIAEITEKLWGSHFGLEADIVYYDYGTLTDPNPDYWQSFEDTIPDDNFIGGHWATETIQDLGYVKGKLSDTRVINLITEAQNEIQAIVDERSNVHVMKAHTILHDLDYWLFRYPPEGFEWAPADWTGINIYYGELDGILYDYTEQDVDSAQEKMMQKYEAILADVIEGKSPDGDGIYMEPPMGTEYYENIYAIYDVDGDGRQELIISYQTASMAGKWECIFDYNPATGEVSREFLAFPALTYYDNGIIKAEWSHNQGKGPDFWPFTLYSYDSDTDSYIEIGAVDTWDKKYFPQNNDGTSFPDDADIDGDGIVYTIRDGGVGDESFYKIWQDGAEYEKWYQSIVGEGSELSIPWKVLENNSDSTKKEDVAEPSTTEVEEIKGTEIKNTIDGNWKTYYELADGSWTDGDYSYKYRLVIKGRLNNAACDTIYVYLSNMPEISFEQAWKASGLSSNSNDYFSPKDAVLVEMKTVSRFDIF